MIHFGIIEQYKYKITREIIMEKTRIQDDLYMYVNGETLDKLVDFIDSKIEKKKEEKQEKLENKEL